MTSLDLDLGAGGRGDLSKRSGLTGRESQILELAAAGMTDKQISAELGISRDTVASYWRRILLKYNAASRTEVVARQAEMQALLIMQSVEEEHDRLLREINERTKSEARELANRNLLSAISEASMAYISRRKSVREVFEPLLNELLSLTTSEYGFISEVVEDADGVPYLEHLALTNIAWDESTEELYKTYLREGLQFRNLDTLFGSIIRTGRVVISEDPYTDPRRGGLPPGHPTMSGFLGIPVFSGEEMVAVMAVANRPGGYTQSVVDYVQPLIATCANIVGAYRSEREGKLALAALAESESLVRLLLDQIPSAVLFENAQRRLQYMNLPFGALFQIPVNPSELVGIDCREAAQASKALFADPDQFLTRVDELLSAGVPVYGELIPMADGRVVERDFIVVLSSSKRVRGYIWMYRDVTSRVTP